MPLPERLPTGSERALRIARRVGLAIAAVVLLAQITAIGATFYFEDAASRLRGDMLATLISAMLMQFMLTGLAAVLLVGRWRDPVALLFAATFMAMAAASDRTGALLGTLLGGWFVPTATTLWIAGFSIGMAVFPDGVFRSRRAAWIAIAALPVAATVGFRLLPDAINPVPAVLLILAAIASSWLRLPGSEGVERQQVKWAGFGFAIGIVLLIVSTILLGLPTAGNPTGGWTALIEPGGRLCLALGLAAFPIALTTALLRYRLWAVDRAIGRSLAAGIVALALGSAWAASQQSLRTLFAAIGDADAVNPMTIAVASAAVSATLFLPLQRRVEHWTQRRFQQPLGRLGALPERYLRMGLAATPAAIVADALDQVIDAVSAGGGDAWLWEPGGMVKLTTRGRGSDFPIPEVNPWHGIDAPGSPVAFIMTFGPAGMIRIAPRPDGSRYPRDLRDAAQALVAPITAALDAAFLRQQQHGEIASLADRIAAIEARD